MNNTPFNIYCVKFKLNTFLFISVLNVLQPTLLNLFCSFGLQPLKLKYRRIFFTNLVLEKYVQLYLDDYYSFGSDSRRNPDTRFYGDAILLGRKRNSAAVCRGTSPIKRRTRRKAGKLISNFLFPFTFSAALIVRFLLFGVINL
jgi:hypothetical protein